MNCSGSLSSHIKFFVLGLYSSNLKETSNQGNNPIPIFLGAIHTTYPCF